VPGVGGEVTLSRVPRGRRENKGRPLFLSHYPLHGGRPVDTYTFN